MKIRTVHILQLDKNVLCLQCGIAGIIEIYVNVKARKISLFDFADKGKGLLYKVESLHYPN